LASNLLASSFDVLFLVSYQIRL